MCTCMQGSIEVCSDKSPDSVFPVAGRHTVRICVNFTISRSVDSADSDKYLLNYTVLVEIGCCLHVHTKDACAVVASMRI